MPERSSPGLDGDWFRRSFDDLYPLLYRHRDLDEAVGFLNRIAGRVPLSGRTVLDLGCGAGRYLKALVDRGASPVGLDLSLPLLAGARALLPAVPLVRGEMRRLPFRRSAFDTVVLMFTTFGYFAENGENLAVLREVRLLLRPGGTLLLDYVNAERLRSTLVGSSSRLVDGIPVEERRWIDPTGPFVRKDTRLGPLSDGSTRTYHERLRLYEPEELETLVCSVGFRVAARLGDYLGDRFDRHASPRLILIAVSGARG